MMRRTEIEGVGLWQFESLAREMGARHFVSDRQSRNGVEFTLSYSSTPDRSLVESNRQHIATALGIDPEFLFLPSQVHETRIVQVSKGMSRQELMNTDALVTNEKGVCVAVMSADCVPVLLFDRTNLAVAAVHSGWKGTVAKILEKTLQRMQLLFGTKGTDLIACIGPSVCQDSYEVGADVIAAVRNSFDQHHDLLRPKGEKAHLDLWEANRIQLLSFGVPPSQIEVANLCTVRDNEHFFSARKGDRGRFAAGIMLV